MRRHIHVALLGAFVVLTGAGCRQSIVADHEKLLDEALVEMDKFATVLESVKDPESAKAAAVEVDKINARMGELKAKSDKLSKLTKKEYDKLQTAKQSKLDEIEARIKKVATTAVLSSGAEQSFIASIQRLQANFESWAAQK